MRKLWEAYHRYWDAADAVKEQDWFAAMNHWSWLNRRFPDEEYYQKRLAEAELKWAEDEANWRQEHGLPTSDHPFSIRRQVVPPSVPIPHRVDP